VACLAVKDNRIIATGINGTPPGEENCDEHFKDWDQTSEEYKKCHHEWSIVRERHAEENMIGYAAAHGISLEGCDIYCSLAPCVSCTRLLSTIKPKRIFYKEAYDKSDVLYIRDYFDKMNIEFIELKETPDEII
jgi:dCMP deaminase